jgi:2',3'-cyclic-nucleotide 2'-phosphodiesterase (5'-nucleotidase family)
MFARRFVLVPLLVLFAACASVPPREGHFRILQINDVYKIEGLQGGELGGLARVRQLRRELEADGSAVLILHGGDFLYPSVMSRYLEARPIVDVMNRLDGDAEAFDPAMLVTFGNHEFDNEDPAILLSRLRDSQFAWVATNTLRCEGGACRRRFAGTEETIVREIDGVRVGFFGLLRPMKLDSMQSSDVVAAARYAVRSLRAQRVDMIVALTHQDMIDDRALVAEVPEIDLVIGGHDHVFMQEKVGDTWITKADADAASVVVYDVSVGGNGAVVATPARKMLDTAVAKDEIVEGAVERWLARLGEKLGGLRTIGQTTALLEGTEPAIRGRETALGNLVTDVMRERMKTDIAFLNGGGIRINDDIPAGPITNYDLEGIFYYRNDLVSFPITGAELLEALANSVSRPEAADGRFLQVSGLSFRYAKQDGRFVVSDVRVGGEPLDPARIYTATTASYLYENGSESDGYAIFSEARRPKQIERFADIRKAFEEHVARVGTVSPRIEGRIVRD